MCNRGNKNWLIRRLGKIGKVLKIVEMATVVDKIIFNKN